MQCLYLIISLEKGLIFESYLSHMGKDGSWEVAVSRTQKVGNFLTVAVFREHGPQERSCLHDLKLQGAMCRSHEEAAEMPWAGLKSMTHR